VKSLIVTPGLYILIPAIAATGGSGFFLSMTRKGRLVDAKKKRMPFIAANGLLILVPAAIFLDQWHLTAHSTPGSTLCKAQSYWLVQSISHLWD
jgi:hypothetical protein